MDLNLNKEFNNIINAIDINNKPNLFLHVCCGPCSSAVLERIYKYFNIYLIYHNPNIDTLEEFNKRFNEVKKLIEINKYDIKILYFEYDHNEYLDAVKGLEKEPEGGMRCNVCFNIRLKKSYDIAKKYIIDNNLAEKTNYLCTTLSISPHKNAELIENIGEDICCSDNFNLRYLPSDFKKENGYLRSIQISKELKLYRQDYCGCEFAKCIN